MADTTTAPQLVRPELAALDDYASDPPVELTAARYGIPAERIVRLDANANPYGCSLRVPEALAAFEGYHHPPDPLQRELRTLLERYSGYSRERILVGSGSELLTSLLHALAAPGDEVIVCSPTPLLDPDFAALCGVEVVSVPCGARFAVNPEAALAAITPRTRAIILASPSDPGGAILDPASAVRLLDSGLLLVVDETWYEYASQTLAPLTAEFDNLVVLRSFGAWAGLSGLDISYGIFPRELVRHLHKLRPGHSLSVLASVAVAATLDGLAEVMHKVRRLRLERGRLYRRLRKLNFLQPYPSQGPSLLCRVTRGEGWRIKQGLERQGVFVRYFPALPDHLCISVGRPEDTDALLTALLRLVPVAPPLE